MRGGRRSEFGLRPFPNWYMFIRITERRLYVLTATPLEIHEAGRLSSKDVARIWSKLQSASSVRVVKVGRCKITRLHTSTKERPPFSMCHSVVLQKEIPNQSTSRSLFFHLQRRGRLICRCRGSGVGEHFKRHWQHFPQFHMKFACCCHPNMDFGGTSMPMGAMAFGDSGDMANI